MLLLQELGQHWQMAQAAEPKQQAAVLPSEMMAPMLQLETQGRWGGQIWKCRCCMMYETL